MPEFVQSHLCAFSQSAANAAMRTSGIPSLDLGCQLDGIFITAHGILERAGKLIVRLPVHACLHVSCGTPPTHARLKSSSRTLWSCTNPEGEFSISDVDRGRSAEGSLENFLKTA
jgi:hypothetical protein